MENKKGKCFMCDVRPAAVGILCHVCADRLAAERRPESEAKKAHTHKPDRYITYQGQSVELFYQQNGLAKYVYCDTPIDKLPKSKTINLNSWCPTLNRVEVKRLKRKVLEINRKEFATCKLNIVKGDD